MTTTSTMSGLGAEEKPTSRVLRPPGGGSSDIFGLGGDTSSNSQPRRQNQRGGSNIFGVEEQPKKDGKPLPPELVASAEEHKIYGKGRNQSRGRFNPITGEAYEEDTSPSPADHKQPPLPHQIPSESPTVGASGGQGDGDLQAAPGKARPDVHTSSRVMNPPGGKATKLW